MTIAELRDLAKWHEERAALAHDKLADARDAGLSYQEQSRMREAVTFHRNAATGLKQLAEAFTTLSALHS